LKLQYHFQTLLIVSTCAATPWDWRTISGARDNGQMEVLRWAQENGCPDDEPEDSSDDGSESQEESEEEEEEVEEEETKHEMLERMYQELRSEHEELQVKLAASESARADLKRKMAAAGRLL